MRARPLCPPVGSADSDKNELFISFSGSPSSGVSVPTQPLCVPSADQQRPTSARTRASGPGRRMDLGLRFNHLSTWFLVLLLLFLLLLLSCLIFFLLDYFNIFLHFILIIY